MKSKKQTVAKVSRKLIKKSTVNLATHLKPKSRFSKQLSTGIADFSKQNSHPLPISSLPFSHLLFSQKVDHKAALKHILDSFVGVNYALRMRQLTTEELTKHSFSLPTISAGKKTLFLDLDETLVHTSLQKTDETQYHLNVMIDDKVREMYFNLRPYCLEFLTKLAVPYEIYIFTASNENYAKAMMQFLNKDRPTITGYLSRDFCLKTSSGFYVKDLSRIANRELRDMVIVDNLTYSFGHLIDNGVPILEFTDNLEDEQLKHLEKYLLQLANVEDIRILNKQYLKLREITTLREYFANRLA